MFRVRVVRDVSCVRSCGLEVCLWCEECVEDPCPAAAPRCPAGVPPMSRSFVFILFIFHFYIFIFLFSIPFSVVFTLSCRSLGCGLHSPNLGGLDATFGVARKNFTNSKTLVGVATVTSSDLAECKEHVKKVKETQAKKKKQERRK